jgi:transcriptional regulator with XRE-family HTH domain
VVLLALIANLHHGSVWHRRRRHTGNMTQEEPADRAGLSVRHLGSIERVAVSASVAVLEQFARALGIDPSEFDPPAATPLAQPLKRETPRRSCDC